MHAVGILLMNEGKEPVKHLVRRLLEGVMHPLGYWMLGFNASVISLVLFPGKGLEMRGVRFRAARLSLSGH